MASLIGNKANQVPVNGSLGTAAFINVENLPVSTEVAAALALKADATGLALKLNKASPVLVPAASATPANNGELVFELTSDTALTVKAKGSDGTVRSVVLTLA